MGILGSHNAEDFSGETQTRFDWTLLGVIFVIMLFGLVNIASATANHDARTFVWRQIFNMGLAFGVIAFVMLFDYRIFERLAFWAYGLNLAALVSVPFIGSLRMGARRWIDLGFMSWQPAESMKFCLILALAKYFQSRISTRKMDFKDLIVPALMIGIPGLLTVIQPDLGTGGHMMIVGAAMLVFVGIRTRVLVTVALIGLVSFPIFWRYGVKEYQKDRVRTFIDPTADPKGEGYNAIQSLIAVGSGQLWGKGWQKGTQTQLDFTPEGHTDFIFTALAEEWGFLGALALFCLYVVLFYRCVSIASQANDTFGSLVSVGVIGMLASQIFINVAMVCGMFPIVGIPLPLLSYGGTSLVTVAFGLSLLLNVGYRRGIF